MRLTTTGTFNVAIGDNALCANTTASSNVAIGRDSLFANTTGTQNVAVGALALDANTTASFNTAVGFCSLYANTTGTNNVAVGFEALRNQTTGSFNQAFGRCALRCMTTGTNNTGIGQSAGRDITTGFRNTVLGENAGLNVTTGSNNLLLGRDSGRTGSPGGAITTASNRIVLGDEDITNAHIQVDWTVASDQRDKTDFNDLNLGLEFVNKLNPVTYKWDKRSNYDENLNVTPNGEHKEDWLDLGFKAQEVEALEIEAGYNKDNKTNLTVDISEDGKQYGIQYAKFVPILVNAIKELKKEIDLLKNK